MLEQLSWCTRDRFTPGIQARTCERTVMAALIRGLRPDVGHSCQRTDQVIQASQQSLASLDRSHQSQYSCTPPNLTELLKPLLEVQF